MLSSLKGWLSVPPRAKRTNKPDLAILFGSCSLLLSSVSGGMIPFSDRSDILWVNGVINFKSLVPGRRQEFKGQLLLRF